MSWRALLLATTLLAMASCAMVRRGARGGPLDEEDAGVVDLATAAALDLRRAMDEAPGDGDGDDGGATPDLAAPDLAAPDLAAPDLARGVDVALAADLRAAVDLAPAADLAAPPDLARAPDLARPVDLAVNGGAISGGPCASGAAGATAFRFRWVNAGGKASVQYEVHGLPDTGRWKAGAYGYQIGFNAAFVDIPLGGGGLQLDGSSFVDVELSTVGVARIQRATLSLYGRSYSVGASGSFNWMTFVAAGATAKDAVSNVAPYQWYSGDATAAFAPGDGKALLRIKAGPSSGSLAVARMELCIEGG